MGIKQFLPSTTASAVAVPNGTTSQHVNNVPRSLRVPIDSVPEIRKESSKLIHQNVSAPRGHLINGVNPIRRQPVHISLPNHYEVTLFVDKFIPSVVNPNQAIAHKHGDTVIIPKDTIVSFNGQTMTLIESAPQFSNVDRGYVRIFSNQLYTTSSNKPIRFASCPGKTPIGTQFQLKAAAISNAASAADLIKHLENDLGIGSGSVITDRQAA